MNSNKEIYITSDEYEKLQGSFKCKTEYDNGKIIMHSDTSIKHNDIVLNIAFALKKYFKGGKCKVSTEQIEVIFDENIKYKPDVFVTCEEAITMGQSFISPPKIIFEVVSKSTASHDYITKLSVYQKYGVLEYNIVEQNGHIVQYGLEDGVYSITNTFHLGDLFTSYVFKDFNVDLEDIFE
ncbi:Uma2 family endonuclease [Clostridium sp.]|uniref:Uma2 family endonuclease n=1 Tax=Clostridium sp. TaxID=1506 RepID=UPI00283B7AE2|nr:Uma2 family endonuclease [Clostridium sp.]MDR3594797.1 Uma2 family endonuclease [Clostridium sp.]